MNFILFMLAVSSLCNSSNNIAKDGKPGESRLFSNGKNGKNGESHIFSNGENGEDGEDASL